MHKAIIFDIDGTAIPSGEFSVPSQSIIETIGQYKDKVHLCAATGRSWPEAEKVMSLLGLVDPCIISGGAIIVNPSSKEILWQTTIEPSDLSELLIALKGKQYHVAYAKGLISTRKQSNELSSLPEGTNTFYVLDIEPAVADQLIESMKHIAGVTISKALSWNLNGGVDLHITNVEATKEHAVIELCDILGVTRDDVVGVGDGNWLQSGYGKCN
jgi:HAD superfamily hydrolase (TIGR01484 family)